MSVIILTCTVDNEPAFTKGKEYKGETCELTVRGSDTEAYIQVTNDNNAPHYMSAKYSKSRFVTVISWGSQCITLS